MAKRFHRTNEHVPIPILFIINSMGVLALVYFGNELFLSEAYYKSFYRFGPEEILAYKQQTRYSMAALGACLLGLVLVLKFKSWIASTLLILASTAVLILCLKYA